MGSASPPQLQVVLLKPPSLVLPAERVEANQGVLYLSNLDQNIAVTIETLSLAELDYDAGNPNPEVTTQLVYRVPGATNILQIPPVVAQVTRFKCGGWVLGLGNNHCLFDGGGAMNFINAWAGMARGEKTLSLQPVLDRSMLRPRCPPQISYPHGEFAEIEDLSREKNMLLQDDLVHASFTFTSEDLEALKETALEEEHDPSQSSKDGTEYPSHSSNGSSQKEAQADAAALPRKKVTTFEALAAHIWRARTSALAMEDKQQTKLLFAVDGRNKLDPPLPRGYLGNGIALAHAIATASELTTRPLSYAVRLVQEAVRMVTGEYIRSAIDFFEVTRARPALVATLVLTTWSRLDFHSTDFGWGEPVLAGPATLPEREAVLVLPVGTTKRGMNVLISLPPAAMDGFKQLVRNF